MILRDSNGENKPADVMVKPLTAAEIVKMELKRNSETELNIVPKKPNWDLKNQISGNLKKLQKRTQRAIVEILREKIEMEQRTDSEDEDQLG